MKEPIGRKINEVSRLFRQTVGMHAQELGLNLTHFNILHYLSKHKSEDVSQNDLCHHLQFKAPTISITLQNMEQDGLLYREKSKQDERKTLVKLTSKGLDKATESKIAFEATDKLLENALSQEEIISFYATLDKLKAVMMQKVKE